MGGLVAPIRRLHDTTFRLYKADYKYGDADLHFSLSDMEYVGDSLPTWSFRLKDLPVGSIKGVGDGRFFLIPPRRVDVRAGEAEVFVGLRRK